MAGVVAFWASNWIERSLRGIRGEGRIAKISEKTFIDRANEFITKIRAASDLDKVKAKAKAKAKPKGESAPNANPEPVWATFELALEAGSKCHKCTARLHGTKGCRACMGHWFEEIRRRPPTRGKLLEAELLEGLLE